MTTAIAIEDVRREVKLLKSLSGHKYLIKYYDACEDANNVYIVMEYVLFPFFFIRYLMFSLPQDFGCYLNVVTQNITSELHFFEHISVIRHTL
jgi:serine/threonine protein kinase